MRFVAKLTTEIPLERPMQIYGDNITEIERWAKNIVKAYRGGTVTVYEMQYTAIATFIEVARPEAIE